MQELMFNICFKKENLLTQRSRELKVLMCAASFSFYQVRRTAINLFTSAPESIILMTGVTYMSVERCLPGLKDFVQTFPVMLA